MALAASVQPAHTENTVVGIGWMLVTVFWFTSLDAGAKYLLQVYPTFEVTWMRFFVALVFGGIAMAPNFRRNLISRKPSLQLVRSGLLAVTTGLFFVGIRTTPLATATSIMFLAPILVTLLSVPLLGEKVGDPAPHGRGGRLPRRPRHRAPGHRRRIGGPALPAGGRLHQRPLPDHHPQGQGLRPARHHPVLHRDGGRASSSPCRFRPNG